ncbi:MAG: S24 family peptidase, partial [Planctomycetes bacterium]|nr:S24 family peptidase [Planctomycetota bacterium]
TNQKTITYDQSNQPADQPPWLPVLGRTAAGITHFWDQKNEQLPGITELTEIISRHQKTSYRQQLSRQITTDINQAGIPPLDHKSVSLIQLNQTNSDGISEFIASEEILDRFPDAFALRIDGDSMAPRIQDADIIILSPSIPARDGAAAVIKIRQQIGVTCKIIRKTNDHIHLIAANEKYETKIIDIDQALWSLAVIWRIRLA